MSFYYFPEPLDLLNQQKTMPQIQLKLPSGGHVVAEALDYRRMRVVQVNSTDPEDYLNPSYQPGMIIELEF